MHFDYHQSTVIIQTKHHTSCKSQDQSYTRLALSENLNCLFSRRITWKIKLFLESCIQLLDIFSTSLTISPRNNLTGHFLPKFWHILPEISSKKIFVLKGLMNTNFFHFLFDSTYFPLLMTSLLSRILSSLKWRSDTFLYLNKFAQY